MKRNSRLSAVLHALLHLAEFSRPMTSAQLADMMGTNPVVVRRTLAGLREAGLVVSEKGHGGGWQMAEGWQAVSLGAVHRALGEQRLLAASLGLEHPQCLVEQTVNEALGGAYEAAEAMLRDWMERVTLGELSRNFHKRIEAHPRLKKELDHGC